MLFLTRVQELQLRDITMLELNSAIQVGSQL
jgi:hypothetical protein